MAESMLTTIDNPYNPFIQFDEWNAFDVQKGYHTLSYLGRIANTSHDLSEADYSLAVEDAINEILFYNPIGIYIKVTEDNFDEMMSKALTDEQKESLKELGIDRDTEDQEYD